MVILSGFSVFGIQVSMGRTARKTTAKAERSAPAPAAIQPVVQITPEVVNFVDVPAGDTYSQTVRITNVDEGTLQIQKITASSADFRITGVLLPVVVAHGTSQSFTISYQAKAKGLAEGQI